MFFEVTLSLFRFHAVNPYVQFSSPLLTNTDPDHEKRTHWPRPGTPAVIQIERRTEKSNRVSCCTKRATHTQRVESGMKANDQRNDANVEVEIKDR